MTTQKTFVEPIPDRKVINALSRTQLEDQLYELHIKRSKLQQRVVELEGGDIAKTMDPAQQAENQRALDSATVIEQRDAGSLAKSVPEPRVGNLEERIAKVEQAALGETQVATQPEELPIEQRIERAQVNKPKDVSEQAKRTDASASTPLDRPSEHKRPAAPEPSVDAAKKPGKR